MSEPWKGLPGKRTRDLGWEGLSWVHSDCSLERDLLARLFRSKEIACDFAGSLSFALHCWSSRSYQPTLPQRCRSLVEAVLICGLGGLARLHFLRQTSVVRLWALSHLWAAAWEAENNEAISSRTVGRQSLRHAPGGLFWINRFEVATS
jgi:hypothetical protein